MSKQNSYIKNHKKLNPAESTMKDCRRCLGECGQTLNLLGLCPTCADVDRGVSRQQRREKAFHEAKQIAKSAATAVKTVKTVPAPTPLQGIDPDDIVVGDWYVATQPTAKQTVRPGTPSMWLHSMVEGAALQCVSVVRQDHSVKLGDKISTPYNTAWLRKATPEEIEEATKSDDPECEDCKKGVCEVTKPLQQKPALLPAPKPVKVFENAKDALRASIKTEYVAAAKKVAAAKAAVEVNAEALIPGMKAWHIFKHQPCVLIEKADNGWTIERENGEREVAVSPAVLSLVKPGWWPSMKVNVQDKLSRGWNLAEFVFVVLALIFSAGVVGFVREHYYIAATIAVVLILSVCALFV